MDPDLIIPNKNLSLNDGDFVTPWEKSNKWENFYHQMLEAVSKFNFSMDTPLNELTKNSGI